MLSSWILKSPICQSLDLSKWHFKISTNFPETIHLTNSLEQRRQVSACVGINIILFSSDCWINLALREALQAAANIKIDEAGIMCVPIKMLVLYNPFEVLHTEARTKNVFQVRLSSGARARMILTLVECRHQSESGCIYNYWSIVFFFPSHGPL